MTPHASANSLSKLRILAFATAILVALTLALVPRATAYAEAYNLWVEGVQVTDANADDILQDPDFGHVSFAYNSATNTGTLTLDNAVIFYDTHSGSKGDSAAIWAESMNLDIVLKGSSTISGRGNSVGGMTYGILVDKSDCNLRISGDGSLNIGVPNSCEGASSVNSYFGICVNINDLYVEDGAAVHVIEWVQFGTCLPSVTGVVATNIFVDDATLAAELDSSLYYSCAIQSTGYTEISGESAVIARAGSAASENSSSGMSFGYLSFEDIEISDISSLNASSYSAGANSTAISSGGSLRLTYGAQVRAYSMPYDAEASYGVEADSIIIEDNSSLYAIGYDAALSCEPGLAKHSVGSAAVTNDAYENPKPWNGTDPLGGESGFRVVNIPGCPIVSRIAGDYANETAAMISRELRSGFYNNLSYGSEVIIARDDDFADALGATGLAGALGCPIILTDRMALSDAARIEIVQYGAKSAFIIGGPGAIKDQVQTDLEEMGVNVVRIYGENSYDTSLECGKMIEDYFGHTSTAFIAMSTNFQDALSMSSLAYTWGAPLILQTWGDTSADRGFTDEAKAFLQGKELIVAGGPGAISDESLEGFTVTKRVYGDTGYDTSNEIAKWGAQAGMFSPYVAVVACGAQAPKGTDALAGSALAGTMHAPILLVNSNEAMEAADLTTIDGYLTDHKNDLKRIVVLGGAYVVPNDTYKDIVDLVGGMNITPM